MSDEVLSTDVFKIVEPLYAHTLRHFSFGTSNHVFIDQKYISIKTVEKRKLCLTKKLLSLMLTIARQPFRGHCQENESLYFTILQPEEHFGQSIDEANRFFLCSQYMTCSSFVRTSLRRLEKVQLLGVVAKDGAAVGGAVAIA